MVHHYVFKLKFLLCRSMSLQLNNSVKLFILLQVADDVTKGDGELLTKIRWISNMVLPGSLVRLGVARG